MKTLKEISQKREALMKELKELKELEEQIGESYVKEYDKTLRSLGLKRLDKLSHNDIQYIKPINSEFSLWFILDEENKEYSWGVGNSVGDLDDNYWDAGWFPTFEEALADFEEKSPEIKPVKVRGMVELEVLTIYDDHASNVEHYWEIQGLDGGAALWLDWEEVG